ncbi:hypothetical protein [uncultured Polaribacter sp.]|uniref:hypothetical protein n=1 Tax=uncultured Polaribacter sp. TaxID=174711 RepID=UPI0026092719|nr:hypothetical protein [uncultured Polaribacter sp.]
MLDQELKDKFYSKYQSFLEEIPSKNVLDNFYIPSEKFYKNSCYYYPNREKFNEILSTLINYNFKKKTFKKEAFFTFLENEYFGLTSINTLEKNLIYQIQIEVDMFMGSNYNCSFNKVNFYQKNNPFKSEKEFHFFIISKILENIDFNPYDGSFSTENEFYLLEEYFDKVMLQLKQKFDILKVEDLHREVIRLEILKEKHLFYFLDSSIKKLESLIVRLNSRSDSLLEEIKEINQDSNNTSLVDKDIERIQTTLVIKTLEDIFNDFFKLNELVYNEFEKKKIKELIQISFGIVNDLEVNKQIDVSFIPKNFRKDFVRIFLYLLEKGKIITKKTLLIETLCGVIKTDGFSRRTLFKINSKEALVKFENYNLRRIIGTKID